MQESSSPFSFSNSTKWNQSFLVSRMVEAYIEEILSWFTSRGMESARLSPLQWLVCSLPIAGQFFAGLILFFAWVTLLFRLEHKGWTKKVSEARAAEHLEA